VTILKDDDTFEDIILKMSQGNVGAIAFCIELLKKTPQDIYLLDEMGLYGSQAYIFWNDCCNRNLFFVNKALNRYSKEEILKHIQGDRGIPLC
jgi:hypothetical protein